MYKNIYQFWPLQTNALLTLALLFGNPALARSEPAGQQPVGKDRAHFSRGAILQRLQTSPGKRASRLTVVGMLVTAEGGR